MNGSVSSFSLSLPGGKKGLLINSTNLCKSPQKALVRLAGQNGKSTSADTRIRVAACAKQANHKRHRRHAGLRRLSRPRRAD
jgi:hypothetical protein